MNKTIKSKKDYKKIKQLFGKEIEIPEEWLTIKLADVGKIISGGTPNSKNRKYWDGDILWAVPTDITRLQTNYIYNTKRKITREGLENCSAKLLPIGTVLLTSRATIGECAITAKSISTNQGFQSISCNNNFDNVFIFYLMSYNRNTIIQLSYGTTFLEISKKEINKTIIHVPNSIKEQQKIASILSDVDALIEKTQKIIDKTEKLKKGLMQQLLTRGIGHTKFKKVKRSFGKDEEIPTEWKTFNLTHKDILNISSGKSIKHIQLEGKYPVYGSNGIIGYTESYNDNNSILIGRVGASGSIHRLDQKAWITDNVLISKIGKKIKKDFCYYLLISLELERFATKSAQPLLTQSILKAIKIKIPSLNEQQKIASILSEIDSEIKGLKNKRNKYTMIKNGMMQKLLTGEIRVV